MENKLEYLRFKPSSELQNFVNCYWFYTVDNQEHEFNILPDAFFDIIIFLNEQNKTIITGIWSKSSVLRFSNASIIGLQFKPRFLCINDLKIADCVDASKEFNLQDLNISLDKLTALIGDKEAVMDYFNTALLEFVHSKVPDEKLEKVFDVLERNILTMNINEMAAELDCTQKTIYRIVMKYLGISPKEYLTIMRFRDSLKKDVNTSLDGFYDQSHFIKNVKKLTGETPKELLADTVRNLQYKDDVDR